jgi:DNA-binding NarL/FixJ family response regulator
MAIRILIADDSDLTIYAAQHLLQQDHRYRVSGTARSMDELLTLVDHEPPDVILLNEWLHAIDVLSAVEVLRGRAPLSRILVMGSLAEGQLICELLDAGVKGYLLKSDDLTECLTLAVDTVMRDRLYLSPSANAEFLVAVQNPLRDASLDAEARQVLRLLAQGYHIAQIALELGVPERRVYWVRQKLRQRFGATTNEHMMIRATAAGFTYPRE